MRLLADPLNSFAFFAAFISLFLSFFYPELLGPLFLINLWLLSYPHTLSTFAKKQFRQPRFKLLGSLVFLTFMIFNGLAAKYWDMVVLINIYFFAQYIHYIRQNYGMAKKFQKESFHNFHVQINGALFLLCLLSLENMSFFSIKIFTFGALPWIKELFFVHIFFILYKNILCSVKESNSWMRFENLQYLITSLSVAGFIKFETLWIFLHLMHNFHYLWAVKSIDMPKVRPWKFYALIVAISSSVIYMAQMADSYLHYYLSVSFLFILSLNFSHYFFDSFLWKRRFWTSQG